MAYKMKGPSLYKSPLTQVKGEKKLKYTKDWMKIPTLPPGGNKEIKDPTKDDKPIVRYTKFNKKFKIDKHGI